MTPHEEHYPRRPAPDWGTICLLVGAAAVALVGILVLTSSGLGHGAPITARAMEILAGQKRLAITGPPVGIGHGPPRLALLGGGICRLRCRCRSRRGPRAHGSMPVFGLRHLAYLLLQPILHP